MPDLPPTAQQTPIPISITRHPHGGLIVNSPVTPGFTAVARGPFQLARAIDTVLREAACATYAAARGYTYDVAALDPPPRERGRKSPQVHDPASWTPLDGETWRSPSGRTYRKDGPVVQAVMRRREAAGLSNEPAT